MDWFDRYQSQLLESFGLSEYSYYNGDEHQAAMDLIDRMTTEQINFINKLPLYWEDDQHILIHSTLDPNESWESQSLKLRNWNEETEDIPLQLRQRTLLLPKGTNKCVISGHERRRKPIICSDRVSIDLGVDTHRILAAWITDLHLLVTLGPTGSR